MYQSAVDYCTVTWCFKKLHSGCKNLNDQAKTAYSEAMLQAIEPNLACSTWRVSSDLYISQSSVVFHLHNLNKITQSC